MTAITETLAEVLVEGYRVTGRAWIVPAPVATEESDDATVYNARNAGKTRTIYAFLNFPYAAQPVGERRWKPALKTALTGPVDCTHYGFAPPQGYSQETVDEGQGRIDLGTARGLSAWAAYTTPGNPQGTREDEACLNMNIYTPDLSPTAGLPVIVDFHEGGANYLSNLDDRMSGHRLAVKGAVIVRVGTRLGNLGHYYLPGMEDEPDYAGVNFSLTDALAALERVQEIIERFGGDPANVTLTGGSNGGQMLHCIVTSPLFAGLWHKWAPCSASGGTDPRVAFEPVMGMPSYQQWAGRRHTLIEGIAGQIGDSQDPTQTLADAIAEHGLATAMREHLALEHFLAIDEGRTGVNLSGTVGYSPTVSLTIKRDGVTVEHANNRAAALAGAYPAAPCMITVCENEASVVGGAITDPGFIQRQLRNLCFQTTHAWARSPVYNTEWDGSPATPSWGALDFALPRFPWGAATEPGRMIFSHGYQHAAYCVARAVEDAGGTAFLNFFNDRAAGKTSTGRASHAADRPYWYNNPLWDLDPPGDGLTTRDIARGEMMAQALVNFAKHGNPNTPYSYAGDFDLFAAPYSPTWVAFNPALKNWNVIGSRFRSAPAGPLLVESVNDFWAHAWDYYDDKIGA